MDNTEFEEFLENRLKSIKHSLGVKAKEYVREGNKLHNFDRGAKISGKTREEVLWNGFALKHLVSVFDLIDDVTKGNIPSKELVDEKIGDLINYLILLEACFQKTRKENE